jgi:hypothetical protein
LSRWLAIQPRTKVEEFLKGYEKKYSREKMLALYARAKKIAKESAQSARSAGIGKTES